MKRNNADVVRMENGRIDYNSYQMSLMETGTGFFIWAIVALVAVQIFFGFIWLSLAGFVIGGVLGIRIYQRKLIETRKNALVREFRDMLESFSMSLGSGKNQIQSFEDALSDMRNQYGEDACIVQELTQILVGVRNNLQIENLLEDFARRSHNEDIESFSAIFSVANRAGGRLQQIAFETKDIISEKIGTELEIKTLISGKKNELNIMIILPFIVVTQLQGIQSGGTVSLQDLVIQVGVKLIALALIIGAYLLGQKLMDIKV